MIPGILTKNAAPADLAESGLSIPFGEHVENIYTL